MVAEYLDESEASDLGGKLKSEGINPYVKRHGLPRFFGPDSNYKVFVNSSDFGRAEEIAGQFRAECRKKRDEAMLLLTKQCPACQSVRVAKIEKMSVLEKVRFFKVSVWRCKDCGSEWYT
jgi:hypothetical protein